jgi:hypothetical protein
MRAIDRWAICYVVNTGDVAGGADLPRRRDHNAQRDRSYISLAASTLYPGSKVARANHL